MHRLTRADLKELLRLAVPLAAAHAGMQLMGFVDTAVVGRLGTTELGAIGIANALFFFLSVLAMGIVMGIDPLAAQALGAGDPARARRVLWQGIWLATICGALVSVPMMFSPAMLPWLGIEPAVVDAVRDYLFLRTFSLIPLLIFFVFRGYLQARLLTRSIVVAMVIGNVFNLGADILLVFGGDVLPHWAGPLRALPPLGISGAAIASILGSIFGMLILAGSVRRIRVDLHGRSHRALQPEIFLQALRIGVPIGLHMGAEVAIFALVSLLAGRLGPREVAAHQVAIMLAAMSFTVVIGIGTAGSVQVGRAIGRRDASGTRRAGMMAFLVGTAFMCVAAVAFLVVPGPLARLVTDVPDVIERSIPLLAIAALFQISDGIQGVGAGVLRGAGDTRFTFLANIAGHWLVGFPIALWLGFFRGQGVLGLWWGLLAGLTVVAVLLLYRFHRLSSRPIEPLATGALAVAIPGPTIEGAGAVTGAASGEIHRRNGKERE